MGWNDLFLFVIAAVAAFLARFFLRSEDSSFSGSNEVPPFAGEAMDAFANPDGCFNQIVGIVAMFVTMGCMIYLIFDFIQWARYWTSK